MLENDGLRRLEGTLRAHNVRLQVLLQRSLIRKFLIARVAMQRCSHSHGSCCSHSRSSTSSTSPPSSIRGGLRRAQHLWYAQHLWHLWKRRWSTTSRSAEPKGVPHSHDCSLQGSVIARSAAAACALACDTRAAASAARCKKSPQTSKLFVIVTGNLAPNGDIGPGLHVVVAGGAQAEPPQVTNPRGEPGVLW